MLKRELFPSDPVFSYQRANSDEVLYFNTGLLDRMRLQQPHLFKRITLDVTPDIYDLVLTQRGIEEPHLKTLSAARLTEPGLGAIFEDGTFSLVDGNHRLVQRYRLDMKKFDVWICTKSVWELCLVNLPPEIRAALDGERPVMRTDTTGNVVSKALLHD